MPRCKIGMDRMEQCKQGRRDSKFSLQMKDFQRDVKGAMQAGKEGATRKKSVMVKHNNLPQQETNGLKSTQITIACESVSPDKKFSRNLPLQSLHD